MIKQVSFNWNSPPAFCAVASDDVHLWSLALNMPETELSECLALLSPQEAERAQRFHFPADRDKFIARRGLLRTILGRYLNIDPRRVDFRYGPAGKPALASEQESKEIEFNCSHSGRLGLIAITGGRVIGVDVEAVRSMPDAFQIVQRFFTPGECAAYSALSSSEQEIAFFHYWTCKEAYIKALGSGLSCPLNSFEVLLESGQEPRLLPEMAGAADVSRWTLAVLTPMNGYAAALVVEGQGWRLTGWRFP